MAVKEGEPFTYAWMVKTRFSRLHIKEMFKLVKDD